MTWLHFLNVCAEINKMLNASIKSLSTIQLAGPRPIRRGGSYRVKQGCFRQWLVASGGFREQASAL
jgi:hypothetical protein